MFHVHNFAAIAAKAKNRADSMDLCKAKLLQSNLSKFRNAVVINVRRDAML